MFQQRGHYTKAGHAEDEDLPGSPLPARKKSKLSSHSPSKRQNKTANRANRSLSQQRKAQPPESINEHALDQAAADHERRSKYPPDQSSWPSLDAGQQYQNYQHRRHLYHRQHAKTSPLPLTLPPSLQIMLTPLLPRMPLSPFPPRQPLTPPAAFPSRQPLMPPPPFPPRQSLMPPLPLMPPASMLLAITPPKLKPPAPMLNPVQVLPSPLIPVLLPLPIKRIAETVSEKVNRLKQGQSLSALAFLAQPLRPLTEMKDDIDYSQIVLLKIINGYLALMHKDKISEAGYCHGIVLLWLTMMAWDMEALFYKMIRIIAECPQDQLVQVGNTINIFLDLIDVGQNPKKYSNNACTQNDIDEIIGEVYPLLGVTANYTKDALGKNLKNLNQINNMLAIMGWRQERVTVIENGVSKSTIAEKGHTVGVFVRSGCYHFFDPNRMELGDVQYSTESPLVTQIWKKVFETFGHQMGSGGRFSLCAVHRKEPSSLVPLQVSPMPTASPPSPTVSPLLPTASPPSPTVSPLLPTASPPSPTVSPLLPTVSPLSPTVSPPSPTVSPLSPTVSPLSPTVSPLSPTVSPLSPTVSPLSPTAPPLSLTAPPLSLTAPPLSLTAPLLAMPYNPRLFRARVKPQMQPSKLELQLPQLMRLVHGS